MNVIERDSKHSELMLSPHDVMAANTVPATLTRSARRGSVVVRYSRVERWDVIDDRQGRVWLRPAQLKLALAVLGGIGIGAVAALAFSGTARAPVKAHDASITLSSPVVDIPRIAASAPAMAPRIQATMARAATAAPVATAVAATPAAAIERPTGPDSESAALAQAFSSNESVSWHNETGTGTVVVGTAAIENGKYCRDVAVLTRTDGAADQTVNSRKCMEPGGRIADQPASAPQ